MSQSEEKSQLPFGVKELFSNLHTAADSRSAILSEEEIKECDHEQMKVIGAALCRTGTKSLREALNILGFKCYHMQDVVINKQEKLWIQAAKAKHSGKSNTINWNAIFYDSKNDIKYQATTDNPGCLYYKELLDFYPNAKVILTQRDFDRWYASAKRTIWQSYIVAGLWQSRYLFAPNTKEFLDTSVWYPGGLCRFDGDLAEAKKFYEAYNKEVIATVPKDQLLVFHVKEGWEPLCKFLDVPIPDCDFPHANKGGDYEREMQLFEGVCKVMNAGILCALSYFAYKVFQHYG